MVEFPVDVDFDSANAHHEFHFDYDNAYQDIDGNTVVPIKRNTVTNQHCFFYD